MGSFINDVTPEGEGQKRAIWGDFQGISGVTKGGRLIGLNQRLQSWSHANGRFPVYEAKVLFSQGRGRM